jgi:hypothetical protein
LTHQIDVKTETESNRGWTFDVEVRQDGDRHRFDVTLNWSDYDLWSHGRVAPQRVIVATMEFLLRNEPPQAILKKFDCAVIRRYFPQVDRELPAML